MFGWLAKMLVTAPVQGSSCSCCESKKKELEHMQQVIGNGGSEEVSEMPQNFSSGSYHGEYLRGETLRQEYFAAEETQVCTTSAGCCGSCKKF